MIVEQLQGLAHPLKKLKLLPGNPRKGDVEAVKRSYERFGQRKPIVALPDGTVIAGNHQFLAAKALGWDEMAVVFVDDDDQTAKAFALADNRTSDLGSYDSDALAELLADVAVDPELLLATGYTQADLDALIGEIDELDPTPDEDPTVPTSAPAKTIKGDIWLLGPHRLMCGDSREPSDVDTLLLGAQINLAFTSPPYAEQRTYDESSGFKPIPPDEYVEWFQMVQANVAAHLAQDGSWFVNIKAAAEGLDRSLYVMDLVIAHVRVWDWHFADEFCWERNPIPQRVARRFKSGHEPVYQFAKNDWKIRPDAVRHPSSSAVVPLGEGAGDTNAAKRQGVMGAVAPNELTDGLAYPSTRLPTFAGTHQATGHSAAFPVGLPEFFVKAYTDEGDTVYDPFMGSGSTMLAAHNQHRIAYGMEISPAYCDIICKRWEQATGITPIHETTKREHSFLD
jgi:DNA modification methylase